MDARACLRVLDRVRYSAERSAAVVVMGNASILTESIHFNRITEKNRITESSLSNRFIWFNSLSQSVFRRFVNDLFSLTNSLRRVDWFMNFDKFLFLSCTQSLDFSLQNIRSLRLLLTYL